MNHLLVSEELQIIEYKGIQTLSFSHAFDGFVEEIERRKYIRGLDLACGYGQKSLYLKEKGFSMDALDHDADVLAYLGQHQESQGITLHLASMKDLPFEKSSLDFVLCTSGLHHQMLVDIKATIAEVYRVLKPGGVFFADFLSVKDPSFEQGEKVEENSFVGGRKGEPGVLHHYSTREEIEELFLLWKLLMLEDNLYRYTIQEEEYTILFNLLAEKEKTDENLIY